MWSSKSEYVSGVKGTSVAFEEIFGLGSRVGGFQKTAGGNRVLSETQLVVKYLVKTGDAVS